MEQGHLEFGSSLVIGHISRNYPLSLFDQDEGNNEVSEDSSCGRNFVENLKVIESLLGMKSYLLSYEVVCHLVPGCMDYGSDSEAEDGSDNGMVVDIKIKVFQVISSLATHLRNMDFYEPQRKLGFQPALRNRVFRLRSGVLCYKHVEEELASLRTCATVVSEWYQSRRSKSWEKPIQNQMQRDGERRYSLNKRAADSLPKYSQRKRISFECKEMLKKRQKEIEAFNDSNICGTIKQKEVGSAIARKDKRARCYICRK
ncbi:hypothetical protein Tco_0872010 [Tanacetum coccineum]